MALPNYMDRINYFTKTYKHIWIIPQVSINENSNDVFESYDIEAITKEMIPMELKEKFNLVLQQLEC